MLVTKNLPTYVGVISPSLSYEEAINLRRKFTSKPNRQDKLGTTVDLMSEAVVDCEKSRRPQKKKRIRGMNLSPTNNQRGIKWYELFPLLVIMHLDKSSRIHSVVSFLKLSISYTFVRFLTTGVNT